MPDKLPLILAGPIVRRVEPALACVWMALSAPRDVKLDVWLGPIMAGNAPAPDFSGTAKPAIRVGFNLYIALAIVEPKTGSNFLAEKTYSYNLTLTPIGLGGNGDKETLASEGLLKNREGEHLALGYDEGRLPTFVLPPLELTDLRIIHGSCRKPGARVPDAMVWIDDLIREQRENPKNRLHQLFLTGDQIYADDVSRVLFQAVEPLGRKLFADVDGQGRALLCDELVPTRLPHLDQDEPAAFQSSHQWFPAGLRLEPTKIDARFTSTDGINHLITLGDFAAHYLLVWNGELWPKPNEILEADKYVELIDQSLKTLILSVDDEARPWPSKTIDDLKASVASVAKPKFATDYEKERKLLQEFRDGLLKVRRVLANVSTYMMFDDHEITDDWFISAAWRDRVLTSPLGRTILRNGLVAYALFQGWGNDPKALDDPASPHSKLCAQIQKLVPEPDGPTFKPDTNASEAIDKLLGFSGEGSHVARWHYGVAGPRHQVYVLDCRTQRSFKSRLSGPGNVSAEALKEQIPDKKLPPETEVVIVVSSLTVLGPPVIDALLGPALYRVFDVKSYLKDRKSGKDPTNIPGLDPDAIEAWPNDDGAFEALLARVHQFKRLVFLSGDVHFATSAAMTYFKKGDSPARFAQFTSSGFKNKFGEQIINLERRLSFMQRLASEGTLIERLGWDKKDPDLLKIPDIAKVRPTLRAKLNVSPVLLPTEGWPEGVKSTKSEWSWRMHIVEDERPDAKRPEPARPADLIPGQPGQDVTSDIGGLRQAAARHAKHLQRFVFGRRLLFRSNLGVVYFERRADEHDPEPDPTKRRKVLVAVHELHAQRAKDSPAPFTLHEVILDPGKEEAPTIPPPSREEGDSA